MSSGNENINEMEIGNTEENLEQFDKCTLAEHHCGFKTKDGFCLSETRCGYSQFEQWTSIHAPNEKSTIEIILETEKKNGKPMQPQEILAITPEDEIEPKAHRYIVDFKGNVFDLKTHRVIKRNLKL